MGETTGRRLRGLPATVWVQENEKGQGISIPEVCRGLIEFLFSLVLPNGDGAAKPDGLPAR